MNRAIHSKAPGISMAMIIIAMATSDSQFSSQRALSCYT